MARKSASKAKPRASKARPTGGISADASLGQAQKTAPYFRKLLADMHAHMEERSTSRRETDYQGHHIVIETTYGVTDRGRVYYHGMPNVGFDSAVDLMKAVVDRFADDFAGGSGPAHPDHHGDHDHEDGGRSHGMRRASGRRTKKTKKRKTSPAMRARR